MSQRHPERHAVSQRQAAPGDVSTHRPLTRKLTGEYGVLLPVDLVGGGSPNSAADSRSLSVSIVVACVGARPRTGRRHADLSRSAASGNRTSTCSA